MARLLAQQALLQSTQESANATDLPDGLKSGIEALSGVSLDGVRVHYNSSRPAQVNALAYAQGAEIYIAPGQEQHLPHEAWHVVQQAQGRVAPTGQMNSGVPLNDDAALEHEADAMGAKALATAGRASAAPERIPYGHSPAIVQGVFTSAASRSAHFNKHNGDFNFATEAAYEQAAQNHYDSRAALQSKVSGGKIYVYDAATDELGVYNAAGQTITFFQPEHGANDGSGQTYYNRQ